MIYTIEDSQETENNISVEFNEPNILVSIAERNNQENEFQNVYLTEKQAKQLIYAIELSLQDMKDYKTEKEGF